MTDSLKISRLVLSVTGDKPHRVGAVILYVTFRYQLSLVKIQSPQQKLIVVFQHSKTEIFEVKTCSASV